jgi:glycosyltransferase involved in cell wall biosynthesis
MKTPKLLIASDNFLPRWDGTARFLCEILPKLKESFDVSIIAPDYTQGKQFNRFMDVPVKLLSLSKLKFGDYQPAKFHPLKIARAVKKADIVFIQALSSIGMMATIFAKIFRKPILAYAHSVEWELIDKSITRTNLIRTIAAPLAISVNIGLYNRVNKILVPAQIIKEKLENALILTKKAIVPLGVNHLLFKPANNKEAKIKLNLNPKELIIGYSGRIGREKDLPTLYKAFQIVKKIIPCKLMVLGKGIEIKEVFQDTKDIIFFKDLNNIQEYLKAMDIYVLPSLTETSSLSTMEAMSCGLPVISTRVGAVPEYIDGKTNGLFFPKKNYKLLAKKIIKLCKNPELRTTLSKNARSTILKKFNWNNTSKLIVQELKGLLKCKK